MLWWIAEEYAIFTATCWETVIFIALFLLTDNNNQLSIISCSNFLFMFMQYFFSLDRKFAYLQVL